VRLKNGSTITGNSYGSSCRGMTRDFDRYRERRMIQGNEANRIEGRVLTGGQPIVDADVIAESRRCQKRSVSHLRIPHLRGRVADPMEHVITRTDADGRFRSYPPADENLPGRRCIRASVSGFGS